MSLQEQESKIKSTILIVDDDIAARDTLEELLAYENYEIICASNGIDALEMARELHPDVILSDVMMPMMNGFEVCRRLRADPVLAEVPIILITGLDDRDSFLKGLDAGADDFISKPFDRVRLSARVAAVVRLNRYRRLMEERAKFERLIELSPDGILLIDSEGTIQMANPTLTRMLHMGEGSSLTGRKITAFAATQYFENFLKFISKAFADPDGIYRAETRFVRMDDTEFPVEISAGHCALQSQPAVQLIIRDITERKVAEEEIRRAKIPGVSMIKESKRFFPHQQLAGHLLGFVGIDNQGLSGLELLYEEELRGSPGKYFVERDAKRAEPADVQKIAAGDSVAKHFAITEQSQHAISRQGPVAKQQA